MLTPEKIDALTRAHGRVKHVTYNGRDLVFRKPSRAEVVQYSMSLENEQSKPFADELLTAMLCVQCGPSAQKIEEARAAWDALSDEYPWAYRCKDVATAIGKLMGVVQETEAKSSGSSPKASGNSPIASPVA
jgi:hypothetical protein